MNGTALFVAGIVILLFNVVILWQVLRRKNAGAESSDGFVLMQNQFNELARNMTNLTRVVDERMVESSKQLNEALRHSSGESVKIIRDITEKLTRLDETNKQVVSFADQLQSLQDILKNPKHRGVLGEYYLETLLKNVLPPGSYEMQYKLTDTDIVDAAVFV